MARLYSNENIPTPVVQELRSLGHDVLTSQEAGNANRSIPDAEVLDFAVSQERALLTLNRRHFVRMRQAVGGAHRGILVCSFDADFAAQAGHISEAVLPYEDLSGKLIRVNRSRR